MNIFLVLLMPAIVLASALQSAPSSTDAADLPSTDTTPTVAPIELPTATPSDEPTPPPSTPTDTTTTIAVFPATTPPSAESGTPRDDDEPGFVAVANDEPQRGNHRSDGPYSHASPYGNHYPRHRGGYDDGQRDTNYPRGRVYYGGSSRDDGASSPRYRGHEGKGPIYTM
ncbi:Aste57867_5004 [Aphanomyces stellatus]|uniref:Aste57867_5004 protein n=2 Tax=Aphanomyces stellatus TaxID=120398 RepID=A0A485KCP9_9STRA|nr:hypothetical protein As57867_004991 [Aphanomyces stellatus]VFT82088.1 Aste57867_5004 [Aphanomyces stellatus]